MRNEFTRQKYNGYLSSILEHPNPEYQLNKILQDSETDPYSLREVFETYHVEQGKLLNDLLLANPGSTKKGDFGDLHGKILFVTKKVK